MNKKDLIAAIHDELDTESTPVKRATIEAVLEALGRIVAADFTQCDADAEREVTLPGLGKLKTSTRAARVGRNPQTGAEIQIPERVVVKFSACKALDDALNP